MASVIFKITVTLPRRVGWVRFPHSPATSLAATLLCFAPFCPHSAYAQQLDSVRVGIATSKSQTSQPQPDTTKKPPMSPRRAFLTSLLIPGYAQTVFGRDRAAMLFSVIEIGSIGMARKAALDLAEAKGLPRDSVVATYKVDQNTGLAIRKPAYLFPTPILPVALLLTGSRRGGHTTRIGSPRSFSIISFPALMRTSPRISGISRRILESLLLRDLPASTHPSDSSE